MRSVRRLSKPRTLPDFWGLGVYTKPLSDNQILVADYERAYSSYEVIDIRKDSLAREIVRHEVGYV